MFWFIKKKEIKYLIISTVIFFATWALCYFGIGQMFAGSLESGDMSSLYKGENFFSIFFTNLLHCLICVGGCAILSVPMLIFDAGSIGVTGVAFKFFGGKFSQYLAMLLPHCIFEIPALLIACACGIKMFSILRRYTRGEKEGLKDQLADIGKTCIFIAILILIAALIEAFLTPTIAAHFGG